jgi:hypothetical protein
MRSDGGGNVTDAAGGVRRDVGRGPGHFISRVIVGGRVIPGRQLLSGIKPTLRGGCVVSPESLGPGIAGSVAASAMMALKSDSDSRQRR